MYFIIGLTIILIDQAVKYFAPKLGLLIIKNYGIIFGLFPSQKSSASFLLFLYFSILIGIIILIILPREVKKANPFYFNLSLVLIIAGGVSNFFDKIMFGYIRDLINIQIWPIFNIADISITSGIFIYAYKLFKS